MKIQGWIVEQFGALRDHEVSEIPDGLTIFCGPNGSGKSTLVAFLRDTLYGSARPLVARSDFAVEDDTGAGRIYCAGPHGVYTIARAGQPSGVRIIRPNGDEGDEVDLQCLFGGPEGALLGSLLAFDVRDLQSLPSLSSPGLRDRIFPANGLALTSLDRVLDGIQTNVSRIAQPADGAVQRLLMVPPELHDRIERASRAASRHCQLVQAQARALVEVDSRTQTISELKAERARYVALVDLWPVWQELSQARHELEHVGPSYTLPANPEVRLEQTLAARQAARYSVDQLVDRGSARRPDVSVTLDDPSGAAVAAIEAHTSESGRFGAQAHEQSRLTEGGRAQLALRPTTTDAPPEWTQSNPRRDDRPGPSPEELTTWQRRLQEVQDDLRERQRELDAAQRTVRELERARNELSGQAKGPEPLSAVVLQEEGRLLQRVRAALAGVSGDHDAVRRWQELIAERRKLMRSLEGQLSRLPSAALAYVAGLAGVLGMAAAAWRYVAGDTPGFVLLLACSLVGVAGAAIQRWRRVRAIADNTTCRSRVIALRDEVEHACQSLLHHEEQVARRRFDISVDSVRLGLPPAPTHAQLQEREAEFEEQQQQRDEWDSVRAALANTTAALTSSQEIERQHAQSLAAAQAHARQVAQEWQRWKADARLADGTGRAGEAHRAGADPLQDCQNLMTELADERSAARPDRVRPQIDERGPESRPAAPPRPAPEPSPALQAALRRLRQCEDDLARLFTEAGVSDEASYRGRLAIYQRHSALEQTIRACEVRLDERLKDEPASETILRELPRGHVDEWSRLAARAVEELNALEAARDEALRHLQQLDADARSALAESADLPVLEVEQAGWATEAREAIRRWRTLALAASLLAEVRRTVECESQPQALRRASQVLSALSCARYERVVPSRDQRELLVFDAKTGLKPAAQLNRAAAEQLYFGLRLGLAEEHAQHGTALPVIIDDVLDSFDPSRRRAMAQQIVQLSGRHQVFVFTSQPDTCELLTDLDPDAHVIRMQEL